MEGGNTEATKHCLALGDLPNFVYDPMFPITLTVPEDDKTFSYAESLPAHTRTALNALRTQMQKTLLDANSTTLAKLTVHKSYYDQLPEDTGEYVVYTWGAGKSMDVAFERFHLLCNIGWMFLHLGASNAISKDYKAARGYYAQAAGAWRACLTRGFREGEYEWPAETVDKPCVHALVQLSLAIGQTAILEGIIAKRPRNNAEGEKKHRRLLSALCAQTYQLWLTTSKTLSKLTHAPGDTVSYAAVMQRSAAALAMVCTGSTILQADSQSARCKDEIDHPYGLVLQMYRVASAQMKQSAQAPLFLKSDPGNPQFADVVRNLVGNKDAPNSDTAVALHQQAPDFKGYQAMLRGQADALDKLTFKLLNSLEGDNVAIYHQPETPVPTVEIYLTPAMALPDTFTISETLFAARGVPSAPDLRVATARDGLSPVSAPAPAHRPVAPVAPDGGLSAEQQVALNLLNRAAELRVLVENRMPFRLRNQTIIREQVMRQMIRGNSYIDEVMVTLRDETIPFLQRV